MNELCKPQVTVIMPVYNGEKYLRSAIDSALSQTFGDWEMVVVDDGSADATPRILEEYKDPRIVKIRQDNAGEARARNVALDQARGEYIAFLDADDLYLPNALTDLSSFLEQHPVYDVVFADGYICNEQGRKLYRLSEVRPGIYTGNILEPLVLTPGVITVPVCTMTRHSSIERCGVRFDERLVIGPDWDFWIQLAGHARFGYLDKLTCVYRVHSTNITRSSGLGKRKRDLLYGRLKVLNADWFGQLSTDTRRKFFYQLLTRRLAGEPVEQQAILRSERFRDLQPRHQAELLRSVGVVHLLARSNRVFAVDCLQEAIRVWPGDRKSRVLLWATLHLGDSALYHVLCLRRALRMSAGRLRVRGRHTSQTLLAELGPAAD